MLAEALRAEVDAYIAAFTGQRGEDGRRLVVRNGFHQSREVLTSAGAVEMTAPRVNDKRTDPATGKDVPIGGSGCSRSLAAHHGLQRSLHLWTINAVVTRLISELTSILGSRSSATALSCRTARRVRQIPCSCAFGAVEDVRVGGIPHRLGDGLANVGVRGQTCHPVLPGLGRDGDGYRT